MSIFYCSECDAYEKHEPPKEGIYIECECGEQVIELSEDDILEKISDLKETMSWMNG